MENPSMGRDKLRGGSFEDDFKLHVLLSTRLDEGTLARFWGSLNQPVRPAIQAWTAVPIVPEDMEPFLRVQERQLGYRDLNQPQNPTERGPTQEDRVRRQLDPRR